MPTDPEVAKARTARTQTARSRRILAAARQLVSERGIARSKVIDIARAAGVSRGLVTYHFSTKNRLLGEVMDADAEDRLEHLRQFVGTARSIDEVIAGLARTFGELDRGMRVLQEFATIALRSEEIASRQARTRARYREVLTEILTEHRRAGIVQLGAEPATVAAVLVALGQGIVSEQLVDPNWDHTIAARYALSVARCILEPANPRPETGSTTSS